MRDPGGLDLMIKELAGPQAHGIANVDRGDSGKHIPTWDVPAQGDTLFSASTHVTCDLRPKREASGSGISAEIQGLLFLVAG